MIDCLLIGFNDMDFATQVDMVKLMGTDSGAFQDLRLSYVDHDGKPYRALDALTEFHNEGRPGAPIHFHNSDFLWPVITYLGSYLHRNGFSFDYVNLFHLEKEGLRRKLAAGNVRSVAITTTLYVMSQPILEIVEFVRECDPSVQIIVGGPFMSNQSKMLSGPDLAGLFEYLGGDIYIMANEGEHTLGLVLDALRRDTPLADIPNLGYRSGSGFAITESKAESNSLSDNMVDYDLFDHGGINEFVTTRTAKSCPFSCAFCGFPQRAGKYTYLDLELVERELDRLKQIPGVSTITFIDDTFNVPKVRFRELLELLIKKDYGFRWNSFYRSDHGDERTIRMMKEAGCEGVFLGVESGSDEMLKRMNKTARRRNYLEALETFNDVGICTQASVIIGFPGETEETVAETISLIQEGRPDFYRAQLWYADPVTPIWNEREKYGVHGEAFNWSHDTMTSAIACDIINDMFGSIKNSHWLPQFGFEQWSVFYLQRCGMSMEAIKQFVHAFNAVVWDQISNQGKDFIEPSLLAELKRTSQFDFTRASRPTR